MAEMVTVHQEIFKDLIGYKGLYQISNYGRLKRLPHISKNRWGQYLTGLFITKGSRTPSSTGKIYYNVSLTKNGIKKSTGVHRLVGLMFIPNPNNFPEINHIDGNPENNFFLNLEWGTHQHNIREGWRIGLMKNSRLSGEKHHNCKLKELEVVEIRQKIKSGNYTLAQLSRDYHMSYATIKDINKRRTWIHI